MLAHYFCHLLVNQDTGAPSLDMIAFCFAFALCIVCACVCLFLLLDKMHSIVIWFS